MSSHRPALTLARCSAPADSASLRVLGAPAASRPPISHRPALTLARCSAPADSASLRVLGAPAASRPPISHRPALTLARCSAPADSASLRVLGAPAASRPPISHRPALTLARCSGAADALGACPRASSRFAASDFAPPCANACAVFRRCAVTPPDPSVTAYAVTPPFSLREKGGFWTVQLHTV